MKVLLVVVLIIFLPVCAFSHPPTQISMTPDFKNNKIDIEIVHPVVVLDRSHWVSEVKVYVDNSEKPIEMRFYYQVGPYLRTKVNIPDLESINTVKIWARSNLGGSLEKSFDIQRLKQKPPQKE